MAITKNTQSHKSIIAMAQAAFPERGIPQIKELTEGMCNAAYMLTYEDGFKTVLKISSAVKEGYMTNEYGLMQAEVRAMKLVAEKTNIKVADIYRYDRSRELCTGDYFFMECLDGVSWISVTDKLPDSVNATLRTQVGQLQRELAQVKGTHFGLLGDDAHRFDDLFDFVYFLIKNVLDDAERRKVVIGVSESEILTRLRYDRNCFSDVTIPSLVHWDMWEGNIFIKEDHVLGIIDWERAMWAEPLMDDRFRHHTINEDFLRGFGISGFCDSERRRLCWYDILLYLTMMTEVTYREYEDDGQYRWAGSMFREAWDRLV